MKLLYVFLLLMLATFTLGGDKEATAVAAGDSSISLQGQQPLRMEDFQAFYIGFLESTDGKRLLALEIRNLDSLKNEIRFSYSFNSQRYREDGEGRIDLEKQHIEFNDSISGLIRQAEDGKLIFQSHQGDTLSHWQIKER